MNTSPTTNGPLHVDAGNRAQAESWNGSEGGFWARHADRFDRAVGGYQQQLLQAAAVGDAERVLDVGCGAGRTTLDAARAASGGRVLGVDLSAPMIQVARRRADVEGITNVTFRVGDAQVYPFEPAQHDLVVSRTGAMFFGDATAAFRNLARSTRPGGRLVLLTWRAVAENEWAQELFGAVAGSGPGAGAAQRPQRPQPPIDGPGPFALSEPGRVRGLLVAAGWDDVDLEPVDGDNWFGTDVEDALSFLEGLLAGPLATLGASDREDALARLRDSLTAHGGPDGVRYGSAAWLVTASRRDGRGADQ